MYVSRHLFSSSQRHAWLCNWSMENKCVLTVWKRLLDRVKCTSTQVQPKRKVQNTIGNLYSATQIITWALIVKTRNILRSNTVERNYKSHQWWALAHMWSLPMDSNPQLTASHSFRVSGPSCVDSFGQGHAVVPMTHDNTTTEQSLIGRKQWRFS